MGSPPFTLSAPPRFLRSPFLFLSSSLFVRKSKKDLVKLDCMRGVVGEICTNQRALTVVKVFLQGVGERRGWGGRSNAVREDRRRNVFHLSFYLGLPLSAPVTRLSIRAPHPSTILSYHPPSTGELEIVWYFLLDCWNLPKSIRSPSSSFQTGNLGSYRLPIFAFIDIQD